MSAVDDGATRPAVRWPGDTPTLSERDLIGLIARVLAIGILVVALWGAASALGGAMLPQPISAVAPH
ncbi:hypothetical protein RDV64_02145 [Acuticoccus sp. MNP-M23]|uniref:hypothetical protein n=1 Tax=Acuticoccus sp. MNP-M23 TaxID=3072793 RepID=UPI002814FC9A|nr:hypothetical protein [Acuticoccus sp. MNP-M23]WMS43227.1 hypothetical protein RDV64_02145 [Acuticoccus sp. MNP-M23]